MIFFKNHGIFWFEEDLEKYKFGIWKMSEDFMTTSLQLLDSQKTNDMKWQLMNDNRLVIKRVPVWRNEIDEDFHKLKLKH